MNLATDIAEKVALLKGHRFGRSVDLKIVYFRKHFHLSFAYIVCEIVPKPVSI